MQKAVDAGDKAKAAELFKSAQPVIDSVADKGLFHKNKAARHKSRLPPRSRRWRPPPERASGARRKARAAGLFCVRSPG